MSAIATWQMDNLQLDKLLQQNAAEVLDWLRRLESDSQQLRDGFNWLGLAEAAAFDARSTSDLLWAEVAISIYERPARQVKPSFGESFMISAMMLRAAMVAKLGSVPGHPVLDIDPIIRWFWDSLTISRQEAEQKAANWRACSIEEIRELRGIKNRLGVISVLADRNKYGLDREIEAWLSLREKLP